MGVDFAVDVPGCFLPVSSEVKGILINDPVTRISTVYRVI